MIEYFNNVLQLLVDYVLVWAPLVLLSVFIKDMLEKKGKDKFYVTSYFIVDGLLLAGLLFILFKA